MQYASANVFKIGIFILFVASAATLLIHSDFNIDFSVFNIEKVETYGRLKAAKHDMLESGYTLSNVAVVPLLFFILLACNQTKTNYKGIVLGASIVFLLLLFSTNFTVLLSYSIVLCVYMTYTILKRRPNLRIVYIMLLVAVSMVVVLIIYEPKFLYKATTGRALLWELAVAMIGKHPVGGICETEFYPAIHPFFMFSDFVNIVRYSKGTFDFASGTCHNMYLNWAMLYGLPAFCIYIYFISTLYKKIYTKSSIAAALTPFIYILIRGLTESSGFIFPSSGIVEFVFDLYLAYMIFHVKPTKKNCSISRC